MRKIAPRAFNTLVVDQVRGTITKRSKNTEKFINEVMYVSLLPSELSLFFPRVIDSSVDLSDPFVTMEYYGYPTLAELHVAGEMTEDAWSQVFQHLKTVLVDHFGAFKADVSCDDVYDMYVKKLLSRLTSMQKTELLSGVTQADFLVVNGEKIRNLHSIWSAVEREAEKIAKNVDGAAVHGDFCFSNILYDTHSQVCRFIDPRGSFGSESPRIFGDQRYDIAKLWHSAGGMYDFITADKFSVDVSGIDVLIEIEDNGATKSASTAFDRVFFSTWDRREIEIICGLMMCSIPVLHYDYPKRQVAIYVRGLQMLNEALGV